jgi:hypothetical protein
MSDNPMDRLSPHDRVSVRAVLAHEGEDPTAALAAAGIVDAIVVPVAMGEDLDLSGGILGNGITPNLTAVLETEQQDDSFDDGAGSQRGSTQPSAQPSTRATPSSAPVTTMLPAEYGVKPLAPVGLAKRAAGAPPNPSALGAASFSPGTQPGTAPAATDDVQPPEPITTAPATPFGKPPPVPGLLPDLSGQNADSSYFPPQTHNSESTPPAAQGGNDTLSRGAAFATQKPEAAPVPFVDDTGQG